MPIELEYSLANRSFSDDQPSSSGDLTLLQVLPGKIFRAGVSAEFGWRTAADCARQLNVSIKTAPSNPAISIAMIYHNFSFLAPKMLDYGSHLTSEFKVFAVDSFKS